MTSFSNTICTLRGGRMTKWKGQAASMSPTIGQLVASVSLTALAAAVSVPISLGMSSSALAQDSCSSVAMGGVVSKTCIDGGPTPETTPQSIDSGTAELIADIQAGFDADTPSNGGSFVGSDPGALNFRSENGISVTQAAGSNVTGGDYGIRTNNQGAGDTVITLDGNVTGELGSAVDAKARRAGGVDPGSMTITTSGDITGVAEFDPPNGAAAGIYATNGGTGDLVITAADGTISGGWWGIQSQNWNGGNLIVDTTGATVNGPLGRGIYARNWSSGGDGSGNYKSGYAESGSVTVTTADVSADGRGIFVANGGTDDLTIDSTDGTVTSGAEGVEARGYGNSGAVRVTTADVTGADVGITVTTTGSDGIEITTTGGTVRSDQNAIVAQNNGTGATTLTIDGDVVGDADGDGAGAGIRVSNGVGVPTTGLVTTPGGTDISITTNGEVRASSGGIIARNFGTGVTTVTANGDVNGGVSPDSSVGNPTSGQLTGVGIYTRNVAGSGAMTITTNGDVSGGWDGINARHRGTGDLVITANGNVDADSDDNGNTVNASGRAIGVGIFATLEDASEGTSTTLNKTVLAPGGALTITATGADNVIDGWTAGIYGRSSGRGPLTITAEGTVRTQNGQGIVGWVDVGGLGDLTITSTGSVSTADTSGANGAAGIRGRNRSDAAGSITINANNVSALGEGIEAFNFFGSIDVTTTGDITTQNAGAEGILAIAQQAGNAEDINVNAATGSITTNAAGSHGIRAAHAGSGDIFAGAQDADISVIGDTTYGVFANGLGSGLALAEQTGTGSITTDGQAANAVYAVSEGTGDATARATGGGAITVNGPDSDGVAALVTGAAGGDGNASILFTDGTITTEGRTGNGLFANIDGTGTGDAFIRMSGGSIITNNRSGDGILINNISTDSGTATVLMEGGSIAVNPLVNGADLPGDPARSDGILILHRGTGLAFAEQSGGTITTVATIGTATDRGSHGMRIVGRAGGATAIQSGDATTSISTVGDGSHGVLAEVTRQDGNTLAQQAGAGSVATNGNASHGVIAWSRVSGGGAGLNATAEQTGSGEIETAGDLSIGLYALSEGDGAATANVTGEGSIITSGYDAEGVKAQTGDILDFTGTQSGDAIATISGGTVTTRGDDSIGVLASAEALGGSGNATIWQTGGLVTTTGSESLAPTLGSHGLSALTAGTGDATIIQEAGEARTSGDESHAAYILSAQAGGETTFMQGVGGSLHATGLGSDGLSAGGVDQVTISVAGSVSGGRAGGTNDFGGAGVHGAGIHTAAGVPGVSLTGAPTFTANLNAVDIDIAGTGFVGALSDHAILVDGGTANVFNDGTVVGYVTMWEGDDVFVNNSSNSLNLRNYQDTDGDPGFVRDTEAVAVNDFRLGADIFTNAATGVIRLLSVGDTSGFTSETNDDAAPETVDTTGQYVPVGLSGGFDAGVYTIENVGVEQSHFVGLETFENAGVITMQDADALFGNGGSGPVAGDVIYITANAAADGSAGAGTFIANGGQLRLDSVLNEGSASASFSDVLVVDGTQLGSGATSISVANAGGAGASTDLNGNGLVDEGEGILLVEVLDAGRSEADVFALAGDGVDANGNDVVIAGAWAYRLVGPGDYELAAASTSADWYLVSAVSPTVPLYESVLPGLLEGFPTLNQRVGNRRWAEPSASEAPVLVFCKEPEKDFLCEVTPEQSEVFLGAADEAHLDGGGLWVRVDGVRERTEPVASDAGVSATERTAAHVQLGYDRLLRETDNGDQLIGGVSLRYGQSSTDVTGLLGSGEIDTDSYGLGASLTWYAQNGVYVDGQVHATWHDSTISADSFGEIAGGVGALSYGTSVEIGREINLNETWRVTPQAQLSWTQADLDGFTDRFGANVQGSAESLQLRLGVVLSHEHSWQAEDGTTSRRSADLGAHVIREFEPESTVQVSGSSFTQEREATAGEITLGGTFSWQDDRHSVYTQLSAATGLDNFGDGHRVGVTAGYRRQWE